MHRRMLSASSRQERGFTLIEMTVVIAIVGLLLGTLLTPLATQLRASQIKTTDRDLGDVREALLGFAMANGRLPCPDTDADGAENGGGAAACANAEGSLPYATLGVPPSDPWGQRYRYRVTAEFARTAVPGATCAAGDNQLGICDTGDITVSTRIATDKSLQTYSAGSVAVVLSHGPNGLGGTRLEDGVALTGATANTDEAENTNGDGTFIVRNTTTTTSGCNDDAALGGPLCEFDDRVIWLAPSLLFNRLVTAGVLP